MFLNALYVPVGQHASAQCHMMRFRVAQHDKPVKSEIGRYCSPVKLWMPTATGDDADWLQGTTCFGDTERLSKMRQSHRQMRTGCMAVDSQKHALVTSNGYVKTQQQWQPAATGRVATDCRKCTWVTTNGCAKAPTVNQPTCNSCCSWDRFACCLVSEAAK